LANEKPYKGWGSKNESGKQTNKYIAPNQVLFRSCVSGVYPRCIHSIPGVLGVSWVYPGGKFQQKTCQI
jgi:hypothetical protein